MRFVMAGLAGVCCMQTGCAPMYSVSSPSALSTGLVYHLPKTVYKVSIKAKDSAVQVLVTPEIHPDVPSFTIHPDRNSAFERDQVYEVSSKGLLTSASSEDIGKLPDILSEAARSAVALSHASTLSPLKTMGVRGDEETVSDNEYKHFMELLLKSNVEFTVAPGTGRKEFSFPGEGGSFVLVVDPPDRGGHPLDENDIRTSLKEAGSRWKRNSSNGVDETILASGVIARPLTSGDLSYMIFIKPEAINSYRQGVVDDVAKKQAKALGLVDHWREKEVVSEAQRRRFEAETEIAILKDTREGLELNRERAAECAANVTNNPATAAGEIEKMTQLRPDVQRSDAFLKSYGEALDAVRAAPPAQLNDAQKKTIVDKTVLLKTVIQQAVDAAIAAVDAKSKARKDALALLESAKRDISSTRSGVVEATRRVALVGSSQTVSMVDTTRAQLVPLRRNVFGESVNTITLVDGVVTKQDIDEKSELYGAVGIPLKVVEAIFDTTSSLWTKKQEGIAAQTEYVKAQTELIKAQAALEEARKPDGGSTGN